VGVCVGSPSNLRTGFLLGKSFLPCDGGVAPVAPRDVGAWNRLVPWACPRLGELWRRVGALLPERSINTGSVPCSRVWLRRCARAPSASKTRPPAPPPIGIGGGSFCGRVRVYRILSVGGGESGVSRDFCVKRCGMGRGGCGGRGQRRRRRVGTGVPTYPETHLHPTSVSRCLGGDVFRCVFRFWARAEALGGRDEPFVMRDEESVTRAKELVTRDGELVMRDEEFVTRAKELVTRDEELVTRAK
jgi:hypothetical protein